MNPYTPDNPPPVPGLIERALVALAQQFPTRDGQESRPLWRDYSYWNRPVNVAVAKANGVWGVIPRAGISWGYQDPDFAGIYAQAGEVQLWRTSYHVPYSDQAYIPQLDNWYAVHSEIDIIPRVVDLEVDRGVPDQQVADVMWDISNEVLSRDGERPWFYSRRLLINKWLASWTAGMLNAHKWILAQYLTDRTTEHPGPPTLPNKMLASSVILHQTADKKPGFPGEVGSAAADYDRWTQGDENQMQQFMTDNYGWQPPSPPPPPPPPDPDLEARLSALEMRLDNAELKWANVALRVAANEKQLADHENRISALETNPPPPPPPTNEKGFRVLDEKTLANWAKGQNQAGYPIMGIYSADGTVSGRIKWVTGDIVVCDPTPVRSDGGTWWLKLKPGANGGNTVPSAPDLYVKKTDVTPI